MPLQGSQSKMGKCGLMVKIGGLFDSDIKTNIEKKEGRFCTTNVEEQLNSIHISPAYKEAECHTGSHSAGSR